MLKCIHMAYMSEHVRWLLEQAGLPGVHSVIK